MADATNMSNHKIVIILDKLIKKTLEKFTIRKEVLCKQRNLFFFPRFTKLRHHSSVIGHLEQTSIIIMMQECKS